MKLAAIAAFALVGLAVAQTIRPIPDTQVRLVGEIPAEWWTYLELETVNGQPLVSFSVPPNQRFVTTHYRLGGSAMEVMADGVGAARRLRAVEQNLYYTGGITRVVFEPGTVLTVHTDTSSSGSASMWGYMEPVR